MTPRPLSRHFIAAWLIVLLCISVFIRINGARDYYYNPDEAMHIGMSDGVTLKDVSRYSLYETHPPFGHYVRHYWLMVSHDPDYVRSMSLLCGVALILLYYTIGRFANGEMTGICCAAIMAFSHACIIQSWLVRNYAFFVLLLSLGLYDYLRWRVRHNKGALIGYGVWGTLACLTHFSGIFFIACIGLYETLAMFRRKARIADYLPWFFANGFAAVAAVIGYALWQPVLAPLHGPFFDEIAASPAKHAFLTLIWPLATAGYALPNYAAALVALLAMAFIAVVRPAFIQDKAGLSMSLRLTGLFFLLGMFLLTTGIYPVLGTQRSLWAMPVMVLSTGWILADVCTWITAKKPAWQPVLAILIIAAGWATYIPAERFSDRNYVMRASDWQSLSTYLSQLTASDVIVAQRSDATLLANPYPHFDDRTFKEGAPATFMPLGQTQVLLDPFYPHEYSMTDLPDTVALAQSSGGFAGKDTLVFFTTGWALSHVIDLIDCPALDKKIVVFPPLGPGETLTDNSRVSAVLMIVPKQAFLDEVLSPGGKAHSCLEHMRSRATVHAEPH